MVRWIVILVAQIFMMAAASAQQPGSVAKIFTTDARNQIVLDVEAAMARAQAAEGVIPQVAADEISAKADIRYAPADEIAQEYDKVRHRMVALLNVWRRSLNGNAGDYVHFGATTVDIYDTTLMLQVRRSILLMIDDLRDVELSLIEMASEHRDTVMIGRTLGQHALPVTFGKKISVWIGENRRHIERLHQVLGRVERSAILKGAVGTYAGLGEKAMAVERRFAQELGLSVPYPDDWHGSRDVFAEYALTLALIAKTQARLGQELFLLQSTDIGETVERRPSTAVGSSTMPHKNNPSLSESLMHAGRVIPRMAEVMLDDVVNFHERDNTSRPNNHLADLSMAAETMLHNTGRFLRRIEVNPEAMRANLDRTRGLIMAQRVVFALSDGLGKVEAEEKVRTIAEAVLENATSFREALLADDQVSAVLPAAEIDTLLDPTTYLGQAGALVDAVIAQAQAKRAFDRVP